MVANKRTREQLPAEIDGLEARLAEVEQTLAAIRSGEVDAVVVAGPKGEQVYTLKGADQTYQSLIEGMKEGAVTLSLDGTILYCNGAFAKMLKVPLRSVTGSAIEGFIAASDQPAFESLFRQGKRAEARAELSLRAADGTGVPVFVAMNTLMLEDARVVCAVITDLRQQKHIEDIVASESLSRAIVEQAQNAIIVCDTEQRVIRASRAAHQLCGKNPLSRLFDAMFPVELTAGDDQRPRRGRGRSTSCVRGALRVGD